MSSKRINRRQFIRRAGAMASAAAVPNIITSAALGQGKRAAASNRIVMGVVGQGGRGRAVTGAFLENEDVQVVAACDVDRSRREAGRDAINAKYGNQDCETYIDMLEMFARPDIDAVLIATGDNWHSEASIMAARAGKDMYCEKPLSVCISESRAVAEAMRKYGRIFQCGTQRRSLGNFRFAVELARSGKLGQLKTLIAEESKGFQVIYDTVLPAEPEPPREEFDWNRWLGPAVWRPYNSQYPTRKFWSAHTDFSGGSVTEWGSHTADLCQWANDADDTAPIEFWREGNKLVGRYANGVELVITTGLRFGTCPVRFEGDEGWVETGDSGQIETYPKSLLLDHQFAGGYPPDNHVRAFLDCVKSREQTIANAYVAHHSIMSCHIANICKRLGRPVSFDPAKEEFLGDEEANRLRTRAYREPWYL